jgi:16S rRNA (uracil1498-N3)-methyltransferase
MAHPGDHPGPLAFVEDLDRPDLAADDLHHLTRVLRLRSGAAFTVGDGRGRWRTARLDGVTVEPTGPVDVVPEEGPPVCVGFALMKGDKPELVVQKLTELGVDRIVPFRADRSVVVWDEVRAAKAITRLRQVARAAAMQSHRPRLPEVSGVSSLADLAAEPGVAVADRGGPPPDAGCRTVLVGPEGGWSDEERRLRLPKIGLPGNVLRAETAAITAGVLLTARRAGSG